MKDGTLEFFIDFNPPKATQQEKGIRILWKGSGRPRPQVYDKRPWADAKAELERRLSPLAPRKPMDGALRLSVKWCFPTGGNPDGSYMTEPPDVDNLDKGLKDVMTRLGFWRDDAQVVEEMVGKYRAARPGLWVRVEWLEGGRA